MENLTSYSQSNKVELVPAFLWTCPECGRDHFERTIVAELSTEEMEELKSEHGVEPWQTGEFLTNPREVHCKDCNLDFGTTPYGE